MKYIATVEGKAFEIEINNQGEVLVDGKRQSADFRLVAGQQVYSLLLDGQSLEAVIAPSNDGFDVLLRGQLYHVHVEDEYQRLLRKSSEIEPAMGKELHLKAPMPGLIVEIAIHEAQQVEKGQLLVIFESMKMQNELRAPRKGTVSRINVQSGQPVEKDQIVVTLS